tara:strand:+ start:4545 stop:5258 length:714 start_codon:yes stop_codon:yes gene_type:complete
MNNYTIKQFSNKEELANGASKIIANHINCCLEKKDRVQISLCGGSTPSNTYKILSKFNLSWEKVDVFLGDERWVELSDESSNALMVMNTLLLNSPGSNARFYSVKTTELTSPEKSAEYYEKIIQTNCNGDKYLFDLMLLGLGEDGHTASLFPYSESLNIIDRYTTTGKAKGHDRITLTHTVLSSARKIIFLISGRSKQTALQRLLDPFESNDRTPAKLVKSSEDILVLTDYDASDFI